MIYYPNKTLTYKKEIYRKIIHLSSVCIPILLFNLGKDLLLPWLILFCVVVPLLDYLRIKNNIFNKIYLYFFQNVSRPIESNILSGASWVIIGATITIILFKEDIALIALLVMSISDSLAAIVGMKIGDTKLYSKTLEGSLIFLISTGIIVFTLSTYSLIFNILAVITSTLVELFSNHNLNDNLLVPISISFILTIATIL